MADPLMPDPEQRPITARGFDFDGVIDLGRHGVGVLPAPQDVIITGRSWQEACYVQKYLWSHGVRNAVFYNPLPFNMKSRESSGAHKARTITALREAGVDVTLFFEDDPVQVEEIARVHPHLKIVHMQHDLTEK